MAKIPTVDSVVAEMKRLKHNVFEDDWDLNIVGLRTMPGVVNMFDDYICVFYKLQEVWQFHCWHATTDPGFYWLGQPGVKAGTAILQPGQYKTCWGLGIHSGDYEALTQSTGNGGFRVWRDNNLDRQLDYTGPAYLDVTGLNLHHAGVWSTQVDKWSAACQVIQRLGDWEEALRLFKKQISAGKGTKFSYTLMEWR